MKRIILMLSTLLALGADSLVHAQQSVLEVIDLKYRIADRQRDDFEQHRQHVQ